MRLNRFAIGLIANKIQEKNLKGEVRFYIIFFVTNTFFDRTQKRISIPSQKKMSEETTVQIIAVVVSSFSLLGAVFMIGLFLGFPQLRSFPFKYVFWLSISDMISSIGFLLVTDALHKGTSSSLTCIV